MTIDLTAGELGTLNSLVFVALTDARSALVMDHIRMQEAGDAEAVAAWERQAAVVDRLEGLLAKMEMRRA